MNRVFQPSINAATQELIEEGLKNMMEHPDNNALIDEYREMKRQMADALARQAVDELVTDVVECQAYKTWLAKELKKDERRSKKRMPSDDLQRVKLYISQLKSSLPAVIPTVTHFTESKDRWGRMGLWRVQSNGYLSGLALDDFDHVQNPEERINEWLQREDFKEITARGGRNSRGKKQERRLLRETVAEVLSMPAVFNGKELKNPTNGEPLENLQAALVIATLKSALNGDHKAAAKIVDWLGESNTVAGININVQLGK